MKRSLATTRGFTLLELMISMAIGLILLSSALMMFRQAVNATWVTSQKSEMQQDFRAAANILQRDISMAGSGALGQQGLAANSVGLPTGVGSTNPVYPCSGITCNYIVGAPVAYPTNAGGAPLLYSIIPGYNLGVTLDATEGPTDIITVAYADSSLALNCYNVTVNSATSSTSAGNSPAAGFRLSVWTPRRRNWWARSKTRAGSGAERHCRSMTTIFAPRPRGLPFPAASMICQRIGAPF
jgi:prepilin-type N-terminal cleavage/methylation domain-containing protein